MKVLEETNLAEDRVIAAIRTLTAGASFVKHLKKEAIQASSVQAEINLLKIAKERNESEVSSMRAEKQERLAEILQSIKIEETKEEIYRKTLNDIVKQLNHIKGSEAKHSEQKQELTDIENQLTTL